MRLLEQKPSVTKVQARLCCTHQTFHVVLKQQTLPNHSDIKTGAGRTAPHQNANSAVSDRHRRLLRFSTRTLPAGRHRTLYANFILKLKTNRKAESICACLHFPSYMLVASCQHEHVATLTLLFPLARICRMTSLLSTPRSQRHQRFGKKRKKKKIDLNVVYRQEAHREPAGGSDKASLYETFIGTRTHNTHILNTLQNAKMQMFWSVAIINSDSIQFICIAPFYNRIVSRCFTE